MAEVRDQFNACVAAAKSSVAEAEQKTEVMKEEMTKWEEEKKRIAGTHNFEPTVTLNVGGNLFTTTTSTLTRYPETMLGAMFSGRHALIQDKSGAYFIDRDGRHFHEILNYLRGSTASMPESMTQLTPRALEELKVEADFYGMKDLMFPAPPFKPANPVVIKSNAGLDSTITQGENQLWYIKHPFYAGTDHLVKVCVHCGEGYISSPRGGCERFDFYPFFTIGRTISNAQPRPPGKCVVCKK